MRQHWLVVGERAGRRRARRRPSRRARWEPGPTPSRGCAHRPAIHRAHSKATPTPPLAAGGFSSPASRAWSPWAKAMGSQVSAAAGRAPGEAGAHLSRRNEGRGLAYLERKRLCLQKPPPWTTFPRIPGGSRDAGLAACGGSYPASLSSGTTLPRIPRPPRRLPRVEVSAVPARGWIVLRSLRVGASSVTPKCCPRYRTP